MFDFTARSYRRALSGCALASLIVSASAWSHQGHTSSAPWSACAVKQLAQACSYTNGHDLEFIGSCRSASGGLICVRNQPLRTIIESDTGSTESNKEHDQVLESAHNYGSENDR